jgi:ABC-2 type transport system permease protein
VDGDSRKVSRSRQAPRPAWYSPLVRAAFWAHRRGLIAWGLGGLIFLLFIGWGYAVAVARLEGGAKALGAAALPLAEALHALVGRPVRLDTFGGYLSWRVLSIAPLLLGIYAAIQGARVVRGEEERGVVDQWLAAGWSRSAIVRDRAVAFALVLATVALTYGLGLWVAAAINGVPDPAGAAIWTGAEISLTAGVFFALALLLSQLIGAARTASGLAAAVMVALYVVTNLADSLGRLAVLRFASPFYYYRQSRPLIQGMDVSLSATGALAGTFIGLTALAAVAFVRRDCGAGLFRRRRPQQQEAPRPLRLGSPVMRSLWTTGLREQPIGLLAWSFGIGAYMVLNVSIAPAVADVARQFLGRLLPPGGAVTDEYLSRAVFTFAALLLGAFVIAQASRWEGDLRHGRVEMALSCPISRVRLVAERLLALAVAVALVVAAIAAGILLGAQSAGISLHGGPLLRALAMMALFAFALGGLATLLAGWHPGLTVPVLSCVLGAALVVILLQTLFAWPDWVAHLSLLESYGLPYTAAPKASHLMTLVGLGVGGTALGMLVTQRQPVPR